MRAIIIALVLLFSAPQPRSIGWIEQNETWVHLYDDYGNRYQTLSSSNVGVIMGFSSRFFVSRNGSWIYLYNAEGNRYKTLPYSSVGDVLSVTERTFISRNGSWLIIWSSNGDKIDWRAVHT